MIDIPYAAWPDCLELPISKSGSSHLTKIEPWTTEIKLFGSNLIYSRRKKQRRLYMSINSERVMKCTQNRKLVLMDIMGGKCALCGFDKFPEALEFHHVDPSTKEFVLSGSYLSRALPTQYSELRKCIMLCSNCHKGVHAGHYKVPENWHSYFDEEKAQYYLNEQKPKEWKCQRCGKPVYKGSTLCVECNKISAQTINRPTRQELKNLIRTLSFISIGTKYNVSDNAIRKWCKSMGLPTKKTEIMAMSEEEWDLI